MTTEEFYKVKVGDSLYFHNSVANKIEKLKVVKIEDETIFYRGKYGCGEIHSYTAESDFLTKEEAIKDAIETLNLEIEENAKEVFRLYRENEELIKARNKFERTLKNKNNKQKD